MTMTRAHFELSDTCLRPNKKARADYVRRAFAGRDQGSGLARMILGNSSSVTDAAHRSALHDQCCWVSVMPLSAD